VLAQLFAHELDRRQGARELVQRIAARAGVDLSPAACWLLARLSLDPSVKLQDLHERTQIPSAVLAGARDMLLERGLIRAVHDPGVLELTEEGHATLDRLTATGAQRLSDLLECWRPEEHPDLARLIATLAKDFFIDASALRASLPEAAGAGAT